MRGAPYRTIETLLVEKFVVPGEPKRYFKTGASDIQIAAIFAAIAVR